MPHTLIQANGRARRPSISGAAMKRIGAKARVSFPAKGHLHLHHEDRRGLHEGRQDDRRGQRPEARRHGHLMLGVQRHEKGGVAAPARRPPLPRVRDRHRGRCSAEGTRAGDRHRRRAVDPARARSARFASHRVADRVRSSASRASCSSSSDEEPIYVRPVEPGPSSSTASPGSSRPRSLRRDGRAGRARARSARARRASRAAASA